MKNFATTIKNLRENKEWSQRKLALVSGVSNTEINRIEKGEREKPSLKILEKLSIAFGITLDELLSTSGLTDYLPHDTSPKQPKDLVKFLNQAEVMFDGDTYKLNDDDRAKIRAALELAFWDAKERNKRKK